MIITVSVFCRSHLHVTLLFEISIFNVSTLSWLVKSIARDWSSHLKIMMKALSTSHYGHEQVLLCSPLIMFCECDSRTSDQGRQTQLACFILRAHIRSVWHWDIAWFSDWFPPRLISRKIIIQLWSHEKKWWNIERSTCHVPVAWSWIYKNVESK